MSIIGIKEVKENLIGNIHLLKKVKGYSAYDIAVNEGFKGTLQEWLKSLKGEKGDTGTLESHTEVDALGHRVINVASPKEDTDAVTLKFLKRYITPLGASATLQQIKPGEFTFGVDTLYAYKTDDTYVTVPVDEALITEVIPGYADYKCVTGKDINGKWVFYITNTETGEPADMYDAEGLPNMNFQPLVTVMFY